MATNANNQQLIIFNPVFIPTTSTLDTSPNNANPTNAEVPPPSKALEYINNLPIELIGDIAVLLASIEPSSIWTFASVCRYWHFVALATPRAWSYVYSCLSSSRYTIGGQKSDLEAPKVQLWLKRAKSSPLDVAIESHSVLSQLLGASWFPWARVRCLHLESLPADFEKVLSDSTGPLTFEALEALSINNDNWAHQGYAVQKKFSQIAKIFFRSGKAEAESTGSDTPFSSPLPSHTYQPRLARLTHLALYNIEIDAESSQYLPQLSQLQSLKLVQCKTDRSFLIYFILPARKTLTSLHLQVPWGTSVFPKRDSRSTQLKSGVGANTTNTSDSEMVDALVEFPRLKELSITIVCGYGSTQLNVSNVIDRFSCPILTHLTIEDSIIPSKSSFPFSVNFPRVTHLYVKTDSNQGNMKLLDMLPTFSPSTGARIPTRSSKSAKAAKTSNPVTSTTSSLKHLTLYCMQQPNNSSFLWRMISDPTLGAELESLRFITTIKENISKTLLEQLNRTRRKAKFHSSLPAIADDGDLAWPDDFARSMAVPWSSDMKSTHCESRLWWAEESLWR